MPCSTYCDIYAKFGPKRWTISCFYSLTRITIIYVLSLFGGLLWTDYQNWMMGIPCMHVVALYILFQTYLVYYTWRCHFLIGLEGKTAQFSIKRSKEKSWIVWDSYFTYPIDIVYNLVAWDEIGSVVRISTCCMERQN